MSKSARLLATAATLLAVLASPMALARGVHSGAAATKQTSARNHGSKAAPGVMRSPDGKIARSSAQKLAFTKSHPCPSTGKSSGACPGYVVDHVVPLKRGGADRPENMQWQTKAAAKAKDKTE